MTNTVHANMTGADVHEPKGIATASTGQVYSANGSGSGSWVSVGTSSFTGLIADFPWPVVQAGWLECDGSDVSTATYSNLYAVMSIQTSGTRANGSAIITSITTNNLRTGYYVFGTGIAAGTTIVSVDSSSQITLSSPAVASGTSTLSVSPWYLNTGTIRLPNLSSAGRFRRSRSSSTSVGQLQADQNQYHTHDVSATTGTESVGHTHGYSGNTSTNGGSHSHTVHRPNSKVTPAVYNTGGSTFFWTSTAADENTGDTNIDHYHGYGGDTGGESATHTHSFSTTSTSNGSTEARPTAIVLMTCVKT